MVLTHYFTRIIKKRSQIHTLTRAHQQHIFLSPNGGKRIPEFDGIQETHIWYNFMKNGINVIIFIDTVTIYLY